MIKRLHIIAIVFLLSCIALAQIYVEQIDVDNLRLDGSTISTTNTNGDLTFAPNGTGKVIFNNATATTVPYLDANKKLTSSSVTPTELGYLSGVTSAIQTQLNTHTTNIATNTTAIGTPTSTNTASQIVKRDGSGNFAAGTITATLSGNVTGNLTGNVTGNVTGALTGNASTATALAANPSDCGASAYATAIDAGGNLTCSTVAGTPLSVVSKSTAYTATTSDDIILASTASGWTLTLYATASNSGKKLVIKKTSSDFNVLTVDANGSETIDGALTTTLVSQYESIEIVSDGSNWHIIERKIPSVWTSCTMTIGGATSAPTKASSPADDTCYYRREGDSVHLRYHYEHTANTGAAAGSGTYKFPIPASCTVDTAKVSTSTDATNAVGIGTAYSAAQGGQTGYVYTFDTTNLSVYVGDETNAPQAISSTWMPLNTASTFAISIDAVVPCTNWKGN